MFIKLLSSFFMFYLLSNLLACGEGGDKKTVTPSIKERCVPAYFAREFENIESICSANETQKACFAVKDEEEKVMCIWQIGN